MILNLGRFGRIRRLVLDNMVQMARRIGPRLAAGLPRVLWAALIAMHVPVLIAIGSSIAMHGLHDG